MIYRSDLRIYKYLLKNKIGGGSFGEVWTAKDTALDCEVALKLLDSSRYSIDERLLEAQIGNRLLHSNVVNIKGADVVDVDNERIVMISMPYFPNGSVLSQLNSLNFLDLKKSIKCLIDILRGLEYLHENGYFHCDIKPNNILVGDKSEYLLSDYGITCYSPSHIAVKPKASYFPHISPEIISDNLYDARTDIYQIGVTAFRLINGISEIKDDFKKDRDSFRNNVIAGKIITPSRYKFYVPMAIRKIINKSVAVEPSERYQTALEMRRALERVQLIGDCTADDLGNLILKREQNEYRYEIINKQKNVFNLNVYKKNIKSGNETRFCKYCLKGLSEKALNNQLQKLCTEIIC